MGDHPNLQYSPLIFGEVTLMSVIHIRFCSSNGVFCVRLFSLSINVTLPYPYQEYVQVKPMLALASLIMKATGTYNEGDFRARSGYLYVSIVYNISICLALWCLAVFWMCVNEDLKPFRRVLLSFHIFQVF